jgi:hypothetical protein
MLRTIPSVLILALGLAACDSGAPTAANATGDGTATAAGDAGQHIRPGQWEATSEVLEMSMPGMPEAMLKDAIGRKTSFSNCVTPEEAAQDPGELMMQDKPGGAKCTRDRFTMKGGKLDAAMTCTGGDMPGTMRLAVSGQYSDTAYETTVSMTADSPEGAPGGASMRMVSRTTAKRTGDCTAETKPG